MALAETKKSIIFKTFFVFYLIIKLFVLNLFHANGNHK